jgi:hypothetical protein
LGQLVQFPVNPFRLPTVDDLLGAVPVHGPYESVIEQFEVDIPLA